MINPLRLATLIVAALVILSAPWWGRRALRALAFFRVRTVRVVGTRYLAPRDIVSAMRLDSTASVWDDQAPRERRVRGLPLVRDAHVDRELPGTIVVYVRETAPVALAPGAQGLRVYDDAARALPIDPARGDIDLPIIDRPDAALTRLLAGVRAAAPALFARISAIRRIGATELVVTLDSGTVLARSDVTPARLAETLPVAADLSRRGLRFAQLDLRYRDQVVARAP